MRFSLYLRSNWGGRFQFKETLEFNGALSEIRPANLTSRSASSNWDITNNIMYQCCYWLSIMKTICWWLRFPLGGMKWRPHYSHRWIFLLTAAKDRVRFCKITVAKTILKFRFRKFLKAEALLETSRQNSRGCYPPWQEVKIKRLRAS